MENNDIHLRIDEKLANLIEKERIDNNEEDMQDIIRKILNKYFEEKSIKINKNNLTFWGKIKFLFGF